MRRTERIPHNWQPYQDDEYPEDILRCAGCKAFYVFLPGGGRHHNPKGWCGLPMLGGNWKLDDAVSMVTLINYGEETFDLADGRTAKFGEGELA